MEARVDRAHRGRTGETAATVVFVFEGNGELSLPIAQPALQLGEQSFDRDAAALLFWHDDQLVVALHLVGGVSGALLDAASPTRQPLIE